MILQKGNTHILKLKGEKVYQRLQMTDHLQVTDSGFTIKKSIASEHCQETLYEILKGSIKIPLKLKKVKKSLLKHCNRDFKQQSL